jgi:signal transduction histidine kinase
LPSAGVLRFCRKGSAVHCTLVAGSPGADWLAAVGPAHPGTGVARQLAAQRSALAGHWIFGGTAQPDGQAKLSLEGTEGTTLQIFNPAADEAIVTFTPCDGGITGAERQGDLITLQREFVSMVSHEFRTPLTAMQGSYYLLRKRLGQGSDEKVTRYLDMQAESIQTLKELVDQVLFLNRLEYNLGELELKPLPVADFVTALVTRFNDTTLTADPRLALTCTVAPDLTLSVDETLFRAALENLISNALKFSPASTKVTLEVSAARGELAVRISDQGRGIPLHQQDKVFSSFFRASNVGVTPGTGVGLAIVKRAVDSHHGRIEFTSAEGVGTTFQLYLPLQPPVPAARP